MAVALYCAGVVVRWLWHSTVQEWWCGRGGTLLCRSGGETAVSLYCAGVVVRPQWRSAVQEWW